MPDLQSIPIGATRTYNGAGSRMRVCRQSKNTVVYESNGAYRECSLSDLEGQMGDGWEPETYSVAVPAGDGWVGALTY